MQAMTTRRGTCHCGAVEFEVDLPDGLQELRELFADRFPVCSFSVEYGTGVDEFKRCVFDVMQIARVFTKQPGKNADLGEPFVLPVGSTVGDLAGKVNGVTVNYDLAHALVAVMAGDAHVGLL